MRLSFSYQALALAGIVAVVALGTLPQAPAKAAYMCRWDKIAGAGGAWTTGWEPNHPTAACGASPVNRVCGGADFSAAQPSGKQISYWPQGCAGPQWTLQCTCQPS